MTIRGVRCALALAFITLMSSHAMANDWFGRPDEPCEPKCYWWWWLGRDQAPPQGQQAAAAQQKSDQSAAGEKDSAQQGARPVAAIRQTTARSSSRKRFPVATWRAAPLKTFDVFPLASGELALWDDRHDEDEAPSRRVERSFDRAVAVVAPLEGATAERTGDHIAVTPQAAGAGAEAALTLEGATVTAVPLADEGVKGVASGTLDAVAIDRFAAGDLRISLAGHPDLTATPLHGSDAPAPGGKTFFDVSGAAGSPPFEAPQRDPEPAAAPLAETAAPDRSVAAAQ